MYALSPSLIVWPTCSPVENLLTAEARTNLKLKRRSLQAFCLFGVLASASSCGSSTDAGSAPDQPRYVFVGAGDIARCSEIAGATATAQLLDGIDSVVFTAGDNAYESGTASEYSNCYEPNWGRHKARTRPAPGNHEYLTSRATGYFDYFGDAAGPPGRGYYSFNLGSWHILSLNSNAPASVGSDQWNWVRADLSTITQKCILAYWHHPVFNSGYDGNMIHMRSIWALLYSAGADVVISGHAHDYERFAQQDPDGNFDPQGIREFVVGTGGANHLGRDHAAPNSEAWISDTFGVIKLTLNENEYQWVFIPTEGPKTDSGTTTCH